MDLVSYLVAVTLRRSSEKCNLNFTHRHPLCVLFVSGFGGTSIDTPLRVLLLLIFVVLLRSSEWSEESSCFFAPPIPPTHYLQLYGAHDGLYLLKLAYAAIQKHSIVEVSYLVRWLLLFMVRPLHAFDCLLNLLSNLLSPALASRSHIPRCALLPLQ